MRYEEYAYDASEISQLENILSKMPEERVVERMGLEYRLSIARERIKRVPIPEVPQRVYVTFQGRPVREDSGIDANFSSTAMKLFTDIVATAAASFAGDLKSMGTIPGRRIGQSVITGVATGSFGFELELPTVGREMASVEGNDNDVQEAVRMIQELLTLSTEGTDSALSRVAEEMHPRVVRKMGGFLDLMRRNDARFALDFEGRKFRIHTNEQLEDTANRLADRNIYEEPIQVSGTMIGILPKSRRFQLNRLEDGVEIAGWVGHEIQDLYEADREYSRKQVLAEIRSVRIGQGDPRYTLIKVSILTEGPPHAEEQE